LLIKLFFPQKKLVLFAHGIEVWSDLDKSKRMMLGKCDLILSVSQYTADVICNKHQFPIERITVLNNCLDPFLPPGKEYIGNDDLRKKYGYQKEDKILFTLTRLSSKERYKGYDKVLEALVSIRERYPEVKYLIAGSFDEQEQLYLMENTRSLGLEGHFKLAGFIPDEALVAHFTMADIYVMPSMKEGFGIVFIEAMYYGLPVIAGNKDGSVDALCNGELGTLVDPENIKAIGDSIEKILGDIDSSVPDKKKLMCNFSYEQYKQKLETVLESQI
jgi:glycosyltransferase involved in cell wall biosynthesis